MYTSGGHHLYDLMTTALQFENRELADWGHSLWCCIGILLYCKALMFLYFMYLAHILVPVQSLRDSLKKKHTCFSCSQPPSPHDKWKPFIRSRVQFLQFSVLQLTVLCSCATEQEGSWETVFLFFLWEPNNKQTASILTSTFSWFPVVFIMLFR